jgi:hypothetical protein
MALHIGHQVSPRERVEEEIIQLDIEDTNCMPNGFHRVGHRKRDELFSLLFVFARG